MERLKEYEENRKLKMAKLHKEEWKRLQKKTAQTTAVSPRSNYLLNKSDVTAKSGVSKGTSSSNSKRLTEKNEVLEKPTDWKTGEKLFHPKINDNSKKILSNETSDRYGTGSSNNVGEMLYRNSFNRRLRKMLAQRRLDEYDQFVRNKSKASKRTLNIMKRALIRDIEIAFHATSGLRTQNGSPTVLIDKEAKGNSKGERNINGEYLVDQNSEKEEDGKNILVEAEELLHTMYILNFLPSATIGNQGINSEASKDLKDSRFVAKLWKVLESKNEGNKHSTNFADGVVLLNDLKKFLLMVVYPGAASRKNRKTQESEEGTSKAPVVTVDLGLDSDTDNSTTNKVNNDANCKISTSEATEVPPQERLRYGSMVGKCDIYTKKLCLVVTDL